LASLLVEITTSLVGKVKHLIAGEARISK
jgi:hypothetical protein